MADLQHELRILTEIDNPHVINFIEVLIDYEFFYLVTEFCRGGELYDRLDQKKRFSEEEAANTITQVLIAIKHLHDKGICHRDLKPENILYETEREDSIVKVIDFGLSKNFFEEVTMTSKIGTPYYMAPEVISGSYSNACDMWSIGVITYCLICGYPPF
jgi:calcium-dependent protein kinase